MELTYRCGRQCDLCFHRDRWDPPPPDLPEAHARAILAAARDAGVARIRLTGGEPLLHPGALPLLEAIRSAGLEAWVNTAGLPAGSTPWEALGALADDVLLPLREPAQRQEMAEAARRIRQGGPARVRFGVALAPARLAELPAILAEAEALAAPLEAYRIVRSPGQHRASTAAELREAVGILDPWNRGRPMEARVRLANAVPFCLDPMPERVARNAFGGRFDDGRSRLVVAPDGAVRPSYALPLVLGRLPEDPLPELWRHPALRALHDPARLPAACRACRFLETCRGGSRGEALADSGRLDAPDPLMAPHLCEVAGPTR